MDCLSKTGRFRSLPAWAAALLLLHVASGASASPEMAIERAAARSAAAKEKTLAEAAAMVPLADAVTAMLRPGCRSALEQPRPGDFEGLADEDDSAIASCEAVMQRFLAWRPSDFAACQGVGVHFELARACETAVTLFLSQHKDASAEANQMAVRHQLMHDSCHPEVLCP